MNSNFKPLIFRFLYMRFKGDISGLDELQERIDDAYFSVLSEVGRNATRNAKNQKTFQNRTGTLPMQTVGALSAMVRLWICGWKRTAPIPMQ